MAKENAIAHDIVVVGAGPAGLAAALALQKAGFNAVCIGPQPSDTDRRTTALLHGSVSFLRDKIGRWDQLSPHAEPLRALRLIDRTGRLFRAPDMVFSACEIGEDAFGYNIPNAILTSRLSEALGDLFVPGAVSTLNPSEKAVTVRLADGTAFETRLVVGADGRQSLCRESAGIPARQWSYDQTAIVCNLKHSRPHDGACTEFHFKSGPLTLVPLPGGQSSLVWVEPHERAETILAMDETKFLRTLSSLTDAALGEFTAAGPRGAFPLSGLIARRFTAPRLALAGEAAHVMPPIGAQGLNLGFRDVADLVSCAESSDDPGAPETLSAYARKRTGDIWTRTLAADALNRTLISPFPGFQLARCFGLAALTASPQVRRVAMRRGMAAIDR